MTTCEAAFEGALPFEDYRARLRIHRDAFDAHYRRLAFVRDHERANAPLGSHRVLVLTEAFCIDSVLNLPIVARLAEASPQARLRIARRDAHAQLAAAFPGRGGASRLPTVIFLGPTGEALGHWSERSEPDHRWMAEFLCRDPMPDLVLHNGAPDAVLGAWMARRFAAQQPFVETQSWRAVRDELVEAAAGRREARSPPTGLASGGPRAI